MSKKRKYKLKRKAWIEPEMMESMAFRGLGAKAMWVLLRFQQKQKWGNMKTAGRNVRVYENTGLTFTYAEAAYFGLSDATFYRAIKQLVERGFLDVEHRGGTFGHGSFKDYTTFKLSHRWEKWGTVNFEEKKFERLMYQSQDVQSRMASKGSK